MFARECTSPKSLVCARLTLKKKSKTDKMITTYEYFKNFKYMCVCVCSVFTKEACVRASRLPGQIDDFAQVTCARARDASSRCGGAVPCEAYFIYFKFIRVNFMFFVE